MAAQGAAHFDVDHAAGDAWTVAGKLFGEMDHNGDGELSWAELHEYLTGPKVSLNPTDCEELFKSLDANGDGCISRFEFAKGFDTFRTGVVALKDLELQRELDEVLNMERLMQGKSGVHSRPDGGSGGSGPAVKEASSSALNAKGSSAGSGAGFVRSLRTPSVTLVRTKSSKGIMASRGLQFIGSSDGGGGGVSLDVGRQLSLTHQSGGSSGSASGGGSGKGSMFVTHGKVAPAPPPASGSGADAKSGYNAYSVNAKGGRLGVGRSDPASGSSPRFVEDSGTIRRVSSPSTTHVTSRHERNPQGSPSSNENSSRPGSSSNSGSVRSLMNRVTNTVFGSPSNVTEVPTSKVSKRLPSKPNRKEVDAGIGRSPRIKKWIAPFLEMFGLKRNAEPIVDADRPLVPINKGSKGKTHGSEEEHESILVRGVKADGYRIQVVRSFDMRRLKGLFTDMDIDHDGGIDVSEFNASVAADANNPTPRLSRFKRDVFDKISQDGVCTYSSVLKTLYPGATKIQLEMMKNMSNSVSDGKRPGGEPSRSREASKAKQSPTQDQVDAATHIFKGYNASHDGLLSEEEFVKGLSSKGVYTYEDAQKEFSRMDLDDNKTIDVAEFTRWYISMDDNSKSVRRKS